MRATAPLLIEKGYEVRVFNLITPEQTRTYEVFAAVQTRVLYQDEVGYRYYEQVGSLTRTEFSELIGWLQESSLYMLGEQSAYGEQILLLSTCSYHTENGRFLVAARRIE